MPISNESVKTIIKESIIDTGETVDVSLASSQRFAELTVYELASLCVLNHLPTLKHPNNLSLEKTLHNIIELGLDYDAGPSKKFNDEFIDRLCPKRIRAGCDKARASDIYFIPQHDIQKADFLLECGNWDYTFKTRYKHPDIQEKHTITLNKSNQRELLSCQYRIFRQIEKSVPDEHVQIQGYAGTGKTHMLSAISEILVKRNNYKRNSILVLVNSAPQLQSLKSVIPAGVRLMTFAQFAAFMISSQHVIRHPRLLRFNNEAVSNPIAPIAQELNIKQIGSYSPFRVSSILFQMVARFCWNRHYDITESVIPRWVGKLHEDDVAYLISHATLLWELVINPPSNFPVELPVRAYHMIKYVFLNGFEISNRYSHIIVDESHDMSDALLGIIERSPQGYIGLGDKFQSTHSFHSKRLTPAIERHMINSIRTPDKLAGVVNFSLELHSMPVTDEFVANRERASNLVYYDRPDIPDKPTAIWVDDLWELFEWAQRLSAAKVPYRVLGSELQLDTFAQACISLYRDKTPSKVIGLSQLYSWDDVLGHHARHRSVQHINKLFEKGYKKDHWLEAKSLQSKKAKYVIGLYQNSRNNEFDSVMLAPAIIGQLYDVKRNMANQSKEALAGRSALSSRLYLGITRSQHTLILPQSFEEFMHFL